MLARASHVGCGEGGLRDCRSGEGGAYHVSLHQVGTGRFGGCWRGDERPFYQPSAREGTRKGRMAGCPSHRSERENQQTNGQQRGWHPHPRKYGRRHGAHTPQFPSFPCLRPSQASSQAREWTLPCLSPRCADTEQKDPHALPTLVSRQSQVCNDFVLEKQWKT